IRASDTEADPGVLPSDGACIVKIDGARHNDMFDGGSAQLKQTIAQTMERFLADGSCGLSRP
ncbi:MAG: alpha/beta hydrolase, partial [Pseudomonadota bacterium]|nr:alpha/beta hydrolase [Pseudomonadota bacterium]